jgi:periplasmic protein TonB
VIDSRNSGETKAPARKFLTAGLESGNGSIRARGEKAMKENKSNFRIKFFAKPDIQPSLFHYIKEKPDPGIFEDMDWGFITHPFHAIKEGWNAPRTKASLFHYLNDEQKTHLTFKELCSDLFTGFRNPLFIPSVFCDPGSLALERAQGRTRKWEASMVSIVIHVLVIVLLAYLVVKKPPTPYDPTKESVSVDTGILYPPQEPPPGTDDKKGGGGGGGGKNARTPVSWGRMADTQRRQLVPPDVDTPKPLLPDEELLANIPSIEMPIDIQQDQKIPIGDLNAPRTAVKSNGTGTGGGIGNDGVGTGQGPGVGPGYGPGKYGGMGGGKDGGIGPGEGPFVLGPGIKEPRALIQPLPPYTEEARKAHIEGVVVLQAVILSDGTVTSFKVLKGLGYGLDDSAINTISTKWRFSPGTRNGTKVDVIANIEVRFRMF